MSAVVDFAAQVGLTAVGFAIGIALAHGGVAAWQRRERRRRRARYRHAA